MNRRVVCAAVRSSKTDIIICSPRHFDSTMRRQINLNPDHWFYTDDNDDSPPVVDQGFVDQFGTFMTREEAYLVAKENNQIIRRCGGDEGVLYSENLY